MCFVRALWLVLMRLPHPGKPQGKKKISLGGSIGPRGKVADGGPVLLLLLHIRMGGELEGREQRGSQSDLRNHARARFMSTERGTPRRAVTQQLGRMLGMHALVSLSILATRERVDKRTKARMRCKTLESHIPLLASLSPRRALIFIILGRSVHVHRLIFCLVIPFRIGEQARVDYIGVLVGIFLLVPTIAR